MEEKKNDVISNPDHYKLKGLDVEVWDVIKSVLGTVGFLGFYKGNIIKYILRANKKNGLEDYKKAKQYLDWYIQELDGDAYLDGQLSYLDAETTKEQPKETPSAVAIDADKILLEDKMKQELTPEEERELHELTMKMLHTALTMTKEEMERHKELVTKMIGTSEEIEEELRQNRKNFYKLQEKLSKRLQNSYNCEDWKHLKMM